MGRMRWQAWAGGIALGMHLLTALPAQAAGPGGKAPAASQNEVEEAKRLNAEVEQLIAQGKYAEAFPLAERALGLREKALGPDHPDVAESLNELALVYKQKGDYARAEPLYLRALAIYEKALGPDHPNVATCLSNLAELYRAKGDYARAEPLVLRALAIYEKALGADHPDFATCLNNLALLYWDKGDYARAEPLHLRALAIREKALGPEHSDVAQSLNNLALLYRAKGDYARAEPLYLRALAIKEKALGPDHPAVAGSLNNLAAVYRDKGDDARAEPLFLRALGLREKALGPDHPLFAQSLNNLASLYRKKGDYVRTEPLYLRALAIWEKTLGPDHPAVALSLNNLAELYQAKGDDARAEPLHLRAMAIWEKALGPDHPLFAQSLNNLAVLYTAQGRRAKAMRALRQAADLQDHRAAAILATGSEQQKRLFMATLTADTHRVLSLHVQHAPTDPDAARLALTVLLRRKGRVLDAMADSFAALRRTLAPSDQGLLEQLASVYSQLATQVARRPGKISPEHYSHTLAQLEHDRETLEAQLLPRSAPFRAEQIPVDLAQVQAALPEGAALVEIALYKPVNLRYASEVERWGKPRYVAYVLHRTGEPTFADLGEAAPLDAAVEKLRQGLADHDRTHDPRPAARTLDARLLQPLRKLLGDTRWVFVSPDGPLHLVPFGALVDEQGQYRVERYLFTYLTSGRELLRFKDKAPAPRTPPLALAAPAFNDEGSLPLPEATHRGLRSIDMMTRPLPPLENTAGEARAIAQLFPDTQVLLGAQATEGALKAVHAPRLLHLATHGFFLPEQPLPEVLLKGPGGEPTSAERAALAQRENPLLRSGIALAGFDRRKSGRDDGVLTALEASGLDLYGTRLVVLSACESGLGEAPATEGVQGLRRALAIAGAETQVLSLWQVDTGRTRELMIGYYQNLHAGAGRSEAMRDVQLAMLANPKTAHPNLWASFVVSGDWRPLSGEPRLPQIGKVPPEARGCACELSGGEDDGYASSLAFAVGLLAIARRRSSIQRLANGASAAAPPRHSWQHPRRRSDRPNQGPILYG